MGWIGKAMAAAGMCAAIAGAPAFAGALVKADFGMTRVSDDARFVATWATVTADHEGLPFAVVDKRQARIYVFEASGRLAGETAVLIGEATGDESAPDVGEHTQNGSVPFEERTTPAGRFISQPGQNLNGEHVVWVDYQAAFAIHRLRPAANLRSREARLASATPDDNRATLGCVVVPPQFYEQVVQRVIGRTRAIVYVLPENTSVREAFNAL